MDSNNPHFFEIGIYHPKTEENIGTLWRSAYQLGATGIFTIGKSPSRQHSDTEGVWQHIPYRRFDSFDQFHRTIPFGCQIAGVEIGGTPLGQVIHPQRCIYLLGSEANGLPQHILNRCHQIISIESVKKASYNVAVAGSLVMYSRWQQFNPTNVIEELELPS
jgi:tRNA G18 (ribose-2'-O)-methylase SpoU